LVVTRSRLSRALFGIGFALIASLAAPPVFAGGGGPTGETILGQSAIEPAYNDTTGNLVYLLTPIKSPFPTHTSSSAVAPLYLVEYPPSSTVPGQVNLNCMGVPGNCPDHDGIVAGVAVGAEPGVYGTDVAAVPGHDHLVGIASSHEDFNIAWEVIEIVFTNKGAANHHLTTLAQINAALGSGDAIAIDLGFAFHCSVVGAAAYNAGTPI
jgi:hypothetical protein